MLRAVPTRRSDAMAMIAPAPAQMPSIADDDRLRTGAHLLDQLTRHAREGEQARHVVLALHLDQRTDDLVHVAAGAEIAAGADDHDVLDTVGILQVAERVAQLGIGFQRQRILPFRPVQGDGRHLAVDAAKGNALA